MTLDWTRFCLLARYQVKGEVVRVSFADHERMHRVRVRTEGDAWKLEATVARRGIALEFHEVRLFAWRRNRAVDLVGFRVDEDGRVFAEARLPHEGTTAKEFRAVLDAVAHESDRMEYALTGKDVE